MVLVRAGMMAAALWLAGGVALAAYAAQVVAAHQAVPGIEKLPVLARGDIQRTACSRTQNTFSRAHYRIFDIDEKFADNVIHQFLTALDYNHELFTQPEVERIYARRDEMLQALNNCELSFPYEIFNQVLRRRYERFGFFIEQVRGGLDVDSVRDFEVDRRKKGYSADGEGLRKLWSDEVTNEYINLLLTDKSPRQAEERLLRRYEAGQQRLFKTTAEDAFSVYENAYATAIDPHTNYFSPEDSKNFNDDMNLSLEGIGAVLTLEDENVVIVSIMPGSPAEACKQLKPKDRIVGVRQENGNYDDIVGWRLNDAVRRIKGRKGSRVTLDIERGEGAAQTSFSVTLVRDKIKLQDRAAKAEIKTDVNGVRVGVLTIKSFYNGLTRDMAAELDKLNAAGVDAVVVDLRYNGGGLLPEAINSTGLFISDGPIVQVRDALGNEIPQYDGDAGVRYSGPLVVMINRLSASSSEIMAAALRDYGRAVLVGTTTFGKGTVQRSSSLARAYDFTDQELGSINYTVAKFYRINGGSTQLRGVEPDIRLPSRVDDSEYGESQEENAMEWDSIKPLFYHTYGDPTRFVPELRERSENRTRDSDSFKSIAEDMRRYQELKQRNSLSLNLEERRRQNKEQQDYALRMTNERLKDMGLKPVAKVSDLPADFVFADPLLDEAINIAGDYSRLLHANPGSAGESSALATRAPVRDRKIPR